MVVVVAAVAEVAIVVDEIRKFRSLATEDKYR
jgi:hypothetical protein